MELLAANAYTWPFHMTWASLTIVADSKREYLKIKSLKSEFSGQKQQDFLRPSFGSPRRPFSLHSVGQGRLAKIQGEGITLHFLM